MRVRVSATTIEGETYKAEGLFAPLADRVAFERHFGVTAAALQRLGDAFDEEGKLREGADPAGVREEQVAFLVWRMLRRPNGAGEQIGPFEQFVESLAEIGLEQAAEEDPAVDPTEQAPPAGS